MDYKVEIEMEFYFMDEKRIDKIINNMINENNHKYKPIYENMKNGLISIFHRPAMYEEEIALDIANELLNENYRVLYLENTIDKEHLIKAFINIRYHSNEIQNFEDNVSLDEIEGCNSKLSNLDFYIYEYEKDTPMLPLLDDELSSFTDNGKSNNKNVIIVKYKSYIEPYFEDLKYLSEEHNCIIIAFCSFPDSLHYEYLEARNVDDKCNYFRKIIDRHYHDAIINSNCVLAIFQDYLTQGAIHKSKIYYVLSNYIENDMIINYDERKIKFYGE